MDHSQQLRGKPASVPALLDRLPEGRSAFPGLGFYATDGSISSRSLLGARFYGQLSFRHPVGQYIDKFIEQRAKLYKRQAAAVAYFASGYIPSKLLKQPAIPTVTAHNKFGSPHSQNCFTIPLSQWIECLLGRSWRCRLSFGPLSQPHPVFEFAEYYDVQ